jgi:hypothetical protein
MNSAAHETGGRDGRPGMRRMRPAAGPGAFGGQVVGFGLVVRRPVGQVASEPAVTAETLPTSSSASGSRPGVMMLNRLIAKVNRK